MLVFQDVVIHVCSIPERGSGQFQEKNAVCFDLPFE